MFAWTDDAVEYLKRLWGDGYTASQIARELSVTRNTVIGKVHRLGLASRSMIRRVRKPVPKKERRKVVINRGGAGFMRNKPILPPQTPEQLSLYKQRILELPPTVHGLEAFNPSCQCGYVHGEPSDQARCGRPKLDGLPYCEDHAKLCYAPASVAQPYPGGRFGFAAKVDTSRFKTVEEFVAS